MRMVCTSLLQLSLCVSERLLLFTKHLIDMLILSFSHPGYFGKVGMRVFHYKAAKHYCPTINIDKIWTLVPQETRDALSKDKAPVIDCVRAVSCFCESVKNVTNEIKL